VTCKHVALTNYASISVSIIAEHLSIRPLILQSVLLVVKAHKRGNMSTHFMRARSRQAAYGAASSNLVRDY